MPRFACSDRVAGQASAALLRLNVVGIVQQSGAHIPKIRIAGLRHEYRDRQTGASVLALDRVDLDVLPGEFLCVAGPSGCGKSTLLSIVAGLILPREGQVLLDGVRVQVPAASRGRVFQGFAILPSRTVQATLCPTLAMPFTPLPQRAQPL